MRKVELKLNERHKYKIIKKLVETNGNKNTAALKLGCTRRNINRLIAGYKRDGKAFFQHGNKGCQPVNRVDDATQSKIVTLYDNKYYNANFTHLAKMLAEIEDIHVSKTFLRELFLKANVLSPLAKRKTKRKLADKLKQEKENTTSKKEKKHIQQQIVALEDSHPRRPRAAHPGELVQMDASVHVWFGNIKTNLHLAVDDCTGSIVGAYFDFQETLLGYYNVLYRILTAFGIPYRFLTDRRTVFEYNQKKTKRLENDTYTQFGYACKQLGIDIKTSSVPQNKGRIERMFGTLQSRLPIELRLAGVTTIEQANEFLTTYIEKFNAEFALAFNHNQSVFEKQPSEEKINLILAILTKRTIDNGHSIRFKNNFYFPINEDGTPTYYRKGTSCLVIQAFDGNLFTTINNTVHSLEKIPEHEYKSKNFSLPEPAKKPPKPYIPPMTHPWKISEFMKHVTAQPHREIPEGVTYEDLWYTSAIYS